MAIMVLLSQKQYGCHGAWSQSNNVGRFQGKYSMVEAVVSIQLLFPGRHSSAPMRWKKVRTSCQFWKTDVLEKK